MDSTEAVRIINEKIAQSYALLEKMKATRNQITKS